MPQSTLDILNDQVHISHQGFIGTLSGVTDEVANFQPHGKAPSIAALWVHEVFSEDLFLTSLTGKDMIQQQFEGKDGISHAHPTGSENWETDYTEWTKMIRLDTSRMMKYTEAVFTATEKHLGGLSQDDLDAVLDLGPMGKKEAWYVIANYISGHCFSITGEISALKGIQGLKGYPW